MQHLLQRTGLPRMARRRPCLWADENGDVYDREEGGEPLPAYTARKACGRKQPRLMVGPFSVGVLLCTAFHGPRPSPKHQALHYDDVNTNNTPENLRWGTCHQNAQDRVRNGRQAKGEDFSSSKLTEKQVLAIRNDGRMLGVIAEAYGVTRTNISMIKSGRLWKHVGGPVDRRGRKDQHRHLRKGNTTGYKGVYKKGDKWVAAIFLDGKSVHLGMHATAEEAARAYDRAASAKLGKTAWTNERMGLLPPRDEAPVLKLAA